MYLSKEQWLAQNKRADKTENHLLNLAIRTSQKKYNYNFGVDFERL